MARRTGIDLSSANAALVHVQEGTRGPELRGFALADASGDADAIAAELEQARRQYRLPRSAVVVARPGDPRAEAARSAGFKVERTISPAEALARVARLHEDASSDAVVALLALHHDSGALAIVRGREVLHEKPLTWSVVSTAAAASPSRSEVLRRYTFLAELCEHLRAAFDAVRKQHGVSVTEFKICGSYPDLGSLTMPLVEEFDIEVETLDTPEPFRIVMPELAAARAEEAIASLQIAAAAGRRRHRPPGIAGRLRDRRAWIPAAAALAGAALTGTWLWTRSVSQTPERPSAVSIAARPEREAPGAPTRAAPQRDSGAAGTAASSPGTAVEPVSSSPPKAATVPQPAPTLPEQTGRAVPMKPDLAPVRPPAAPSSTPAPSSPPARPTTAPKPVTSPASRAAPPVAPARTPATAARPTSPPSGQVEPSRPVAEPGTQTLPSEGPQRPAADRLPPAPLEVTSILWSADRKLAVVNGRIVGVGDTVDGFEIVEVRQDSVIVRDGAGRRRRAALGASKP